MDNSESFTPLSEPTVQPSINTPAVEEPQASAVPSAPAIDSQPSPQPTSQPFASEAIDPQPITVPSEDLSAIEPLTPQKIEPQTNPSPEGQPLSQPSESLDLTVELWQSERSPRTDVSVETDGSPLTGDTSSGAAARDDSPTPRPPAELPAALFSRVIKSLESDRHLGQQLNVDPSRPLNLKLKVNSQLAWEGQYAQGQLVKQHLVDSEQVKKLQAVIPLLNKAEGEAVAGPNVTIKVNGKELFAVKDGKVVTNALSPQVKQQLMGISLEVGNEAGSSRTSGERPVTQKPSLGAFQQQQERKKDLNRFAQARQVFRDLTEKPAQKETQPSEPQRREVER